MSRFAITVFVLALSLLDDSLLCFGQAAEKKPVPKFEGTELPTPPQQTAEWEIPETTLPETLVSATKIIFNQGLADPRGCEYREIEIGVRYVSHGERIVKTHGWLIPSNDADPHRFAVCWNGLVYPVISIGEPADVQMDVEAMHEAERQRREKHKEVHRERELGIHFRQIEEQHAVDYTFWRAPIKVCLLLRLGEIGQAEESWRLWNEGVRREANSQGVHMDDPYFLFAQHWIWALFDRGVCAHMHGDHGLSLASCEFLAEATERARATVIERGFTKGFSGENSDLPFAFLKPLPILLEEQRRRVKQEPYQTAIEKGLETFDSKEDLIAALIRDLENVSARQWGQPGGVFLQDDPIVSSLIEQGADAVDPLIVCIASDMRLTRSVSYHRDFGLDRNVISVERAAFTAICDILETRELSGPRSFTIVDKDKAFEHKAQIAAGIRDYWNTIKDKPLAQRWYDVLADDDASVDQWVEAADHIAKPLWYRSPKHTLRGETLRGLYTPDVSELMATRARHLVSMGSVSPSTKVANLLGACNIALDFAKWNPQESLPPLRTVMSACTSSFSEMVKEDSSARQFGRLISQLTVQRVEAGDETALGEYAAYIRDVTPSQIRDTAILRDSVDPLWKFPAHPAIVDVSEFLFNDESSPWNPLIHAEPNPEAVAVFGIFHTHRSMIRNPAFRKQILRGLTNHSEAGSTLTVDSNTYEIHIQMGVDHNGRVPRRDDAFYPAAGAKGSFRVCDLYAWSLREADSPPIALYWPEAERDKAIAAWIEFVTNYKAEEDDAK